MSSLGAMGGPVKALVMIPVNQGIDMAVGKVAGEQIQNATDIATNFIGKVITSVDESYDEFAERASGESYEDRQARIKDGSEFILGTVLGIGGGKGSGNSNSTVGVNGTTGPYDPNRTRKDLEDTYGAENVTSTTVPNNPHQRANSNPDKGVEVIYGENGGKAVKVTYDDPVTGKPSQANIPYNDRGLPVFDDVAQYTTDIDKTKSRVAQMSQATRDLREGIKSGQVDPNQFTDLQIRQIKAGSAKIDGFTWHHNADSNNMQLIPQTVHDSVKHIGQGSLGEGR